MRLAIVLSLVFAASAAVGQSALWTQVSPGHLPPAFQPATLSPAQLSSLHSLLRQEGSFGDWGCEASDMQDLFNGLRFSRIPVSSGKQTILVEAGPGCARGAQGANGAMWLLHFKGAAPVLLATPRAGFSGWVDSVQPPSHHGYRDVVLGWHVSAVDAELSYFRFDGKLYRRIGSASLLTDENGQSKIVPKTE